MAPWVLLGIVVLYVQLFLGGWVSSNYVALACVDFPLCQGQVWPTLAINDPLTPWHGLGIEFESGILATDARVTIHLMHRLGAAFVLIYLGGLASWMMRGERDWQLGNAGRALAIVLLLQVGLGIANVILSLPLAVAVAHSGLAALLLLTLVSVYHVIRPVPAVA